MRWHWNLTVTRMTLLGSEHSVLIRSKFRSGKIFHTEPLSSTLFGIEGGKKQTVQKYRILFIPFNDFKITWNIYIDHVRELNCKERTMILWWWYHSIKWNRTQCAFMMFELVVVAFLVYRTCVVIVDGLLPVAWTDVRQRSKVIKRQRW